MTADWIIAEADRLIGLPHKRQPEGEAWWSHAATARRFAYRGRHETAAWWLARAEVTHKGYGDVDTIADRILNGVSTS